MDRYVKFKCIVTARRDKFAFLSKYHSAKVVQSAQSSVSGGYREWLPYEKETHSDFFVCLYQMFLKHQAPRVFSPFTS